MIDFHGVRIPGDVMGSVGGTYEAVEMAMCSDLLRRGDGTIVAGCGMGWLAAWVGSIVGPGHLIAFEPQRELVDLCRANVAVNGFTLPVVWGALAAVGGTVTLGGHRNWAERSTVAGAAAGAEEVPAWSLPDLLAAGVYDCLVLDVEGAEVALLTDAVLARLRKLVVEIHDGRAATAALDGRLAGSGMALRYQGKRWGEPVRFQAWERA